MRRRDLLGMVAGSLLAPRAWALGEASKLDVVELDLGEGTLARTSAWKRLLAEVEITTSIETSSRVVRLDPLDPALFEHPIAVLVGNGALSNPSDAAVEQLRRYITYGGFLLIDDATGADRSAFDDSVHRLVKRLFPTRPMAPLPTDHSLYRAFFLIRRPVGRVQTHRWLEGVDLGETTRIVYCRNDLSGALARGPDGRDLLPVEPGGSHQRREAVKLAINLVVYALTSNYKKDQAHVRQLLLEGRLE
jgi:hypothetical protein